MLYLRNPKNSCPELCTASCLNTSMQIFLPLLNQGALIIYNATMKSKTYTYSTEGLKQARQD